MIQKIYFNESPGYSNSSSIHWAEGIGRRCKICKFKFTDIRMLEVSGGGRTVGNICPLCIRELKIQADQIISKIDPCVLQLHLADRIIHKCSPPG